MPSSLEDVLPSTTDDSLLDNLDIRDIFRFATVCVSANDKVVSYWRRRCSIYVILYRFFSKADAVEFRLMMRSTGMLISGSSALQLFNRNMYEGSDLDLFVNRTSARTVADWLMGHGYTFFLQEDQKANNQTLDDIITMSIDPDDPDPYLHRGRDYFSPGHEPQLYEGFAVLNFVNAENNKKIQVIATYDCPMNVILSFHSTVVFNVVSYSKAYSLYPRATFLQHRSLGCNWRSTTNYFNAVKKYISRGWRFLSSLSQDKALDPKSAFACGGRRLGDSMCWTIEFASLESEVKKERLTPLASGVENDVELNIWLSGLDRMRQFSNHGHIFYSTRLSQSYLIGPWLLHSDIVKRFNLLKAKYPEESCLDSHLLEIYE